MPNIKAGDIVKNSDIVEIFRVGNMGGMRRSNTNNVLVLISDHTKGFYDDKWYGDVLYYTGMGKHGDQKLNSQNRTLAESGTNGVIVHLFEVMESSKYIYEGVVTLYGTPYQTDQEDKEGNIRKVWIFPLQTNGHIPAVDDKKLKKYKELQEKNARKLSLSQLKKKAKEHSSSNASYRQVSSNTYIRDPYVSEYAKRRAGGVCQLCGKPAPFKDESGKPYLESHHIIWLSEGGSDSIDNTVALCPNCHRKMHVVNSKSDKEILKHKI